MNGQEIESGTVSTRQSASAHAHLSLDPIFLVAGVGYGHLFASRSKNRTGTPSTPHHARIRNALVPLAKHIMGVRDRFTCVLCDAQGKVRFAVHHIVPVEEEWARVGDPTNLVTLCFRCHLHRAHAGRWQTIDPVVQEDLRRLAAERERALGTPQEIVRLVQERLAVLGRELGRA
jgi:hypothetical protein